MRLPEEQQIFSYFLNLSSLKKCISNSTTAQKNIHLENFSSSCIFELENENADPLRIRLTDMIDDPQICTDERTYIIVDQKDQC